MRFHDKCWSCARISFLPLLRTLRERNPTEHMSAVVKKHGKLENLDVRKIISTNIAGCGLHWLNCSYVLRLIFFHCPPFIESFPSVLIANSPEPAIHPLPTAISNLFIFSIMSEIWVQPLTLAFLKRFLRLSLIVSIPVLTSTIFKIVNNYIIKCLVRDKQFGPQRTENQNCSFFSPDINMLNLRNTVILIFSRF